MKPAHAATVLLLLLLAASCKKTGSGNDPQDSGYTPVPAATPDYGQGTGSCRLAAIVNSPNIYGYKTVITYDAAGRFASWTDIGGGTTSRTITWHSPDSATGTFNGIYSGGYTGNDTLLFQNGRIVQRREYNTRYDYPYRIVHYHYDAAGHPSLLVRRFPLQPTASPDSILLTWQAGNLTQITYRINGAETYTYFTYTTEPYKMAADPSLAGLYSVGYQLYKTANRVKGWGATPAEADAPRIHCWMNDHGVIVRDSSRDQGGIRVHDLLYECR